MTHFIKGARKLARHILSFWKLKEYPHVDKTAIIDETSFVWRPDNLIMEAYTNIGAHAYIMNTRAKVIIKKYSGIAFGFSAVTGNHMSVVGMNFKQATNKVKDELDIYHEMDKDIVVEEDVWIGNHVTILSGVHIGRGSIVGGGSVVRENIPPYAVVIGNPCKIVRFRYTPEEIIEHEKVQYEENERLPLDLLQKNYEKYFLKKIKEINQFVKL